MDKFRAFKSQRSKPEKPNASTSGDTASSIGKDFKEFPDPILGMTGSPFMADPDLEEAVEPISDDEELGSVENQKSVIMHVLSQLKQGKDLTRVVLPTFILEKHSLLEMFSNYMAHPLTFINITNGASPKDRIVNVVKWFLLSLHAGKKDKIAKKPFNPIIGEIFQCSWRLIDSNEGAPEKNANAPLRITYCAEQVSHHPPITVFRFTCPQRKMELVASIHTQSRWKGLSIYVNMIGKVTVKLGEHGGEEYQFVLPTTYARSILTVPWIELVDLITVKCPQTGYSAQIQFHKSSKVHGMKQLHMITGEVFGATDAPSPPTPIWTVEGNWNATLKFTDKQTGKVEEIDTRILTPDSKFLRPVNIQAPEESQRLWFGVTTALGAGNINEATAEKTKLEEIQRISEQARIQRNVSHTPKYFKETPDGYVYIGPDTCHSAEKNKLSG